MIIKLRIRKQYRKNTLFSASLKDGKGYKEVVVKFSLRYGIDVHQFLASKNKAPEVLHFTELPGKWFVVVMEKVTALRKKMLFVFKFIENCKMFWRS